ncbi:aldose 1-epimerase [Candidatus Woesearchaeota archaeon]|nr:aldose 1-epimerase [Candidatus Woesearchaeota archaeon]
MKKPKEFWYLNRPERFLAFDLQLYKLSTSILEKMSAENTYLISPDGDSKAIVSDGELVNYIKVEEELIHQKGEPGWRNSDTEMFPVIGPTKQNDFRVSTPRGECIQDQHGLLRELAYVLVNADANHTAFQKKYSAGTPIKNSRYPEKSSEPEVFWPFDFEFRKEYELADDFLKILFHLESEKGMPFMFGYHPAFKLSGSRTESLQTRDGEQVSLDSVIEKGGKAHPLFNTEEIKLVKPVGYSVVVATHGFGNIMLWTEVPEMVCIEPITHYPSLDPRSEQNLRISQGREDFSVLIKPVQE